MRKQTFDKIKDVYLNNQRIGTHWEGCYNAHPICCIVKLVKEIDRMKIELDKRNKTIKSYQKLKEEVK